MCDVLPREKKRKLIELRKNNKINGKKLFNETITIVESLTRQNSHKIVVFICM